MPTDDEATTDPPEGRVDPGDRTGTDAPRASRAPTHDLIAPEAPAVVDLMALDDSPQPTGGPSTGEDRWRPSRAGIINLWRYWEETFVFHRGRLLLRGPNGSGKSMALELLLPFLLDGDASPNRLTSAAKSRGGLYERVMTGTTDATRAGFAWIEFRRGADTFTVGVRVRASASTRSFDRSLFTTTRAVGDELHLLDDTRHALSRKDLVDAVGPTGRVTDSAEEHRDHVRTVLFPGFTPDRYDSVIVALLALRREKLSQHLDLPKLSEVLSEALPPLDDHDITAVAEGFERLDRRREDMAALEADLAEIKALATRQRRYARSVVAAAAAAVRAAESRRTTVVRRQREAVEALDSVTAELAELDRIEAERTERQRAVNGEIDGIRASTAYREAAQLADLRGDARALEIEREELRQVADRRRSEVDDAESALDQAGDDLAVAQANALTALDELRGAAEVAGAGGLVDEAVDAGPEAGHRLVNGWGRARREEITEIRDLLAANQRAIDRRDQATAVREDQQERHDALTAAAVKAVDAHAGAVEGYVAAVRSWVPSCSSIAEIRFEKLLSTLDHLADPARTTDVVDDAVAALQATLATEAAVAHDGLERDRTLVTAELDDLAARRDELAAGHEPGPAPPAWRSPREGGAGATLWESVDVVADTAPESIDGIEAALTGSGLLDAWIFPDGSVDLPAGAADLALGPRPVSGPSLADHLRPASDPPVAADVIQGVLRSIAITDGPLPVDGDRTDGDPTVVMATDGRFQLGSAVGRAAVQPASFLGAAARERHRLAELEQVGAEIAEQEHALADLDRRDRALTAQMAANEADLAARPDGGPVDTAAAARQDADTRLGEARDQLARAGAAVKEAEDVVRSAQRSLATRCAATRLPSEADGLSRFETAIGAVESTAATWHRRGDEEAHRQDGMAAAERGRARATGALQDAHDRGEAAARRLTSLTAKVAAIEASLGAGYDDLMARIEALESEDAAIVDELEALRGRRPELDRRVGALESIAAQAEADLADAEEARSGTHRQFSALFTTALPDDAGVDRATEPLDGTTAVLTHARATAAGLDEVAHDDDDIDRASRQVEERLHQARATVGTRIDLAREESEPGWLVLHGSTGGTRQAVTELSVALTGQLAAARAELAAEETKLFERTLAGSIRHALADRIRAANALVSTINEQLAEVRTAAGGVAVRLKWDVDEDQPDAVRAARALLLRDPADLSADERTALQEFVRARVDQARAELELHAPWEARLRESLDYRVWHAFSLQLAHRDWDGYKAVTPRLLQRLSTGERSIALHLPMLASIAAHYTGTDSGPLTCPRLILLDELFAGVDADNRAKLFGTFTAWDLDAVFTSDHEWCQYATLDGIAIHHLHAGAGDEPVTSTRFTWDGRSRTLDPSAA